MHIFYYPLFLAFKKSDFSPYRISTDHMNAKVKHVNNFPID
ncbi:hypothetical protein B4065_3972 [Caldibacillus thermoamylovorans]|nr:hypothetical protein B4065_3972 [Caldibacillus thermoamylovorans]KIO69559.1 hypothetical protein B4166_1856 [Caldibacillus thermoamylovorans]